MPTVDDCLDPRPAREPPMTECWSFGSLEPSENVGAARLVNSDRSNNDFEGRLNHAIDEDLKVNFLNYTHM